MNNCKKCGNQIIEGQKFCSNCGEPTNNIQTINNTIAQESREVVNQNLDITQVVPKIEQQTTNNNKNNNNKLPYIILIAIVIVLVGVISVLLILNNKKDDKKTNNNNNKNEYEENITDDDIDIDIEDDDDIINDTNNTDSITFKGFKFKKNNAYTYQINGSALSIVNSSYYIGVTINNGKFDSLKNNLNVLESAYSKQAEEQSASISITNLKLKKVNNTEIILGNAVIDGRNGIWYIVNANNNYVLQGFIIDRTNTHNENNINIVLPLIEDIEYVGSYESYSSTTDIKDIITKQGQ